MGACGVGLCACLSVCVRMFRYACTPHFGIVERAEDKTEVCVCEYAYACVSVCVRTILECVYVCVRV